MITMTAKCYLKPDQNDNFKTLAKPLIEESQKEAGCIAYDLYEDIQNDNIVTFIEVWKDQGAIDEHHASVHFREIVPQLRAFQLRESEVNVYHKI